MLDKQKYFSASYLVDSLNMDIIQYETAVEFSALAGFAPENMVPIDAILAQAQQEQAAEVGKKLFGQLPWSGHEIGYYLARAIEKAFGTQALVEAQYSCVDFLWLYQKVAVLDPQLFRFSAEALTFLESL